ncbi:T9SS type A sorting domain-containing protein [Hymenobacter volaticus]|uniref:T9SS type A sorting domain-containing protein n=1 Tax=Hymenobacter volaticus TaxID=2932254 RepID=A0ABY4G9N0_9BACT|nr:T9SS type A sorting domain-containing protein [Hymenobacter volaticus]UOQ67598.1 T9SS type A sorting domain-containing protein [Hymenobacter volaticus]
MKKTLYKLAVAVLSLCATGKASAQAVPNGNLENWEQRNGSERPVNWSTTDDLLDAIGVPVISNAVSKTSDKQSGTFAVKLENKALFGGLATGGFLALGTLPDLESEEFLGVPFTSRPTHLQFHYKQTGTNIADDSARVVVALTRYVNGHREVVGGTESLLRSAPSSYTLMSLPLRYLSTATPDSVFLLFDSATAESFTLGNALYLDNIAFTGTVAATRNESLAKDVQVYPNPSATGLFTLTATGREAELVGTTLTVTDAQGRTVLRQAYSRTNPPRTIDLQSQPAGLYLLHLDTPKGVVVQRLIKS